MLTLLTKNDTQSDTQPNNPCVDFLDLIAEEDMVSPFLIEPFIPEGGVTLLHGKKSLGKSPLTWELGHAVAMGRPFLHKWPTKQGTVLYIELDTPKGLVKPRLRKIEAPHPEKGAFQLMYLSPFDVLCTNAQDKSSKTTRDQLLQAHALHEPRLVIINTLRKCHTLEQNDSGAPSRVYTAFQQIFPGASLIFVHHDKKTTEHDGARPSSEAFLGSIAWVNDAQTCLHLVSKDRKARLLTLEHTYNQAAPHGETYDLQLDQDGTRIRYHNEEADKRATILAAYEATDPGLSQNKRVAAVSAALGEGFSAATIRRFLRGPSDPQDPLNETEKDASEAGGESRHA